MSDINQNYYKYTFGNVLSEIELAELYEMGFEAFEEKEFTSEGYFPEAHYSESIDALIKNIAPFDSKELIVQQNWNEIWESGFDPITVADKIFIRASFHPVSDLPIEIIIDPKMAFGTGHHATTYMVLSEMLKVDCTNKDVLDFGCGSGILAIAAQKLGAKLIKAIDYDIWSVDNTIENADLNNCTSIHVVQSDNLVNENKAYDIILANITRDILVANSADIYRLLKQGGISIYSGFIPSDALMVKKCLNKLGVSQLKMIQSNDWACMVWIK